ncbi:MAG: phosphotransferase family protein, partial [Pseudomonadota bacterium]
MSRIDLQRLEAWAKAHVAGFAGPISATKIKGGQSNPTY